jgi:hypothetical protein
MPQRVLPTNQEDREVYLWEHGDGRFIDLVKSAKRNDEMLIIKLDDPIWGNEPEQLYVALSYARDEDMPVTIAPSNASD